MSRYFNLSWNSNYSQVDLCSHLFLWQLLSAGIFPNFTSVVKLIHRHVRNLREDLSLSQVRLYCRPVPRHWESHRVKWAGRLSPVHFDVTTTVGTLKQHVSSCRVRIIFSPISNLWNNMVSVMSEPLTSLVPGPRVKNRARQCEEWRQKHPRRRVWRAGACVCGGV